MSPSNIRKVKPLKIHSRSRNKKLAVVGILVAVVVVIAAFFVLYHPSVSGSTKVLLKTSMGDIIIELRDDMPITTGNFKSLVQKGVYDDTIFHRVIPDFMIQGGDPTGTGYGDPAIPSIPDEFTDENYNFRGAVAMANSGPNTGSSQFFINIKYNFDLDAKHPVFGTVIDGLDVVDAISKVTTTGSNGSPADKPLQDIRLIKAEIIG
jgi:peptidylprolyl isomerase